MAMLDIVRRLRASGVAILDLSGGEPDFATPAHITAEASEAMLRGFTHYTQSRGMPELLAAIADKLCKDNGVIVDPDANIIVTPSAKHALFVSFMTVLDPGDDVLIPTPAWVSYQAMASLVGARPVPVPLKSDQGFRITRAALDACVTAKTKALVINTPNNPTGRVLDRQEAEEIAAFAAEHRLVIIADEIYEKILYDGRAHLSLASLPSCADRTLTVNGFSKGYAMTGWRLGYLAGPAGLIKEALKVQEHTVSCAASFTQRAGVAALTSEQGHVREMAEEYAARRRLVVAGLNALPGITCAAPEGAFYVFPDVRGTGFPSSADFAEWLLREAAVAVTPGTAFGPGGEGHVRLSFAVSRDLLAEAVDRMAAALSGRRTIG